MTGSLLLAAVLSACASSEGAGDDPDGQGGADAVTDVSGIDVSADADVAVDAPDAAEVDAAPGDAASGDAQDAADGAIGAPCEDDADCDSGYCISTLDGQVCTEICTDTCPDGWDCRILETSGGDVVQICVPVQGTLCRACETDLDCGGFGALCLAQADGRFCGAACSDEGGCPDGYQCDTFPRDGEVVDQCVPELGICGGCLDDDADGRGVGPDCLAPDCDDLDESVYDGAPELCDGIDNDCDEAVDEGFDLSTDDDNCGTCGVACSAEQASTACVAGACSIAACDAGFGDCDEAYETGCEVDLRTTLADCGACGAVCSVPNAFPACVGGVCGIERCVNGWADCNGLVEDGCEVDIESTVDACGACDAACGYDNAAALCIEGTCGLGACEPLYGDCNELADDGCETRLDFNDENCGACGVSCVQPATVSACVDAACRVFGCDAGFGDCNELAEDGCEVSLATSIEHCGDCDRPCRFNNASAECVDGGCALAACDEGFVDLDGLAANGCEYACVVVAEDDAPDDAFVDANCDGIDGDAARAVFLAPGGVDERDGLSPATAVRSPARALTIATDTGRDQILVAVGTYPLAGTLPLHRSAAVGWYGGYAEAFTLRSDSPASFESSASPGFEVAANDAPVVVDRVDLRTLDRDAAPVGAQTLVVRDTSAPVVLRMLTVLAGRGADGVAGAAGATPPRAQPGTDVTSASTGGAGVGAGARRGGNGGSGSNADDGQPGDNAALVGPGCGRGGGGGDNTGCFDGSPSSGERGQDGCPGTAGGSGTAGDPLGSFAAGLWAPVDGTAGAGGTDGGGGGGGGAGGGESCFVGTGTGRGGGGGGEGGLGGGGGGGGRSGGASIALALVDAAVQLERVVVRTRGGGAGGAGGAAGGGGQGGQGGDGGRNTDGNDADGGRGGDGGDGGDGGCGGAGAGGPSVGIWGQGEAVVTRVGAAPLFELGAAGAPGAASSGCVAPAAAPLAETRGVEVIAP